MLRVLAAAAALGWVITAAPLGQSLSVLHIKVTLADADLRATPVPRYALLISDNPATAAPRRIVTGLDGTADVRLRPGSYTVESDKPVAFGGKSYEWAQTVEIADGRDGVLELSAANAEAGPMTAAATPLTEPLETDPLLTLQPWQDSVVALWTPTVRATGFVVDVRGLIATNHRVIGSATSIEVQISPSVKVAGRVLASDKTRDVAIVWIDAASLASARPVPLGCALPARPPLAERQTIFTIGSPLQGPKGIETGAVSRIEAGAAVSDFTLADGGAGGPVFSTDGALVGLTSGIDDKDGRRREQFSVVRVHDVCEVLTAAGKKMSAPAPSGSHLPVEPARRFTAEALAEEAKRRIGTSNPYMTASNDFDIAFITPIMTFAAQQRDGTVGARARGGSMMIDAPEPSVRALDDFGSWSAYVADSPPVLIVRATPKLVQGFWTTVARGAAMTQGIAVPSIKHFKAGFARMRAFCGDKEVTPIHPFRLEHRLSEDDTILEGLYVFDPGSLSPQCPSVRFELYSEKAPSKADTRAIDPKIVQRIWQDFAPLRN